MTPSSRRKSSNNFGINGTPNHLDKIENLQMDFSAVKDISDSFGSEAAGLKTPTAHVKSQNGTPASAELKNAQNDIFRLRDQIMAIKSDFSNAADNRETVDAIVNKLSGMLETYEQVSAQYENQLKQFLMARKASKLDTQSNEEFEKLKIEYEKVRNDLYNEIKENDQLKNQLNVLEDEISRQKQKLSQKENEIQQNNARTRTEQEIEMLMEEEHRKRTAQHEGELKTMKARHEEELRQKKMQIADLQNEVAFLKQSEKVLEEELNSRRYRVHQTDNSDNNNLADELFNVKRQAEEFKRLWEDAQASKLRSEEYYRGEIERVRKESHGESDQFEELRNDLKELGGRLKQTRADNEELTWALETSRKETERLNGLIEEQAQKLTEREKKLQGFSDRIRELEGKELQSREVEGLQAEIKRLTVELGEERAKSAGPLEQLAALKRKVALIEREKELLEEQLKMSRLSAYSQGEFQTFSTFIQGLKRHIEAEILSIEPLKLTLQDVVRAKEMVDILLKVTEDVRVKVLNHLSQVEEVIKSRFSVGVSSVEERINGNPSNTSNASYMGNTLTSTNLSSTTSAITPITNANVETVKIERGVRNYDLNNLSDLRRRIDFRGDDQLQSQSHSQAQSTQPQQRTLREPLGVTSAVNANNRFSRSSSSDSDLESRMNNFRNLVSDLRSRTGGNSGISGNSGNTLNTLNTLNTMNTYGTGNSRPAYYNPHSHNSHSSQLYSHPTSNSFVRAHEPLKCNLCQEYGHDALSCPDYLSGTESFSEDLFLKDVRNSKLSSRFAERTRV